MYKNAKTSILVKTDVVRCITTSVYVALQHRFSRTNVVFAFFFNMLFILLINLNLQIEIRTNPGNINYY